MSLSSAPSRLGAAKKSLAPALERGLRVLEFLRKRQGGAAVAEIARQLGIPPASAYRLLNTLEDQRYVVRDARENRYRLGSEILLLAGSMLARMDLRSLAHPYLLELFEQTKETIELVVLESDHLVVIDKVEGEESVHTQNVGGRRAPLWDSCGLVLLHDRPEKRVAAIVEQSAQDLSARGPFPLRLVPALLERVRKEGFMADDGLGFERSARRARRIAVPIRNHIGQTQGALAMVIAISRWKPELIQRRAKRLLAAAQAISELLGFHGQAAT